jgi:hypothetical protein
MDMLLSAMAVGAAFSTVTVTVSAGDGFLPSFAIREKDSAPLWEGAVNVGRDAVLELNVTGVPDVCTQL